MQKVVCKKCGKRFEYGLTGPTYPGGKDREYADCPYCGETAFSTMTSQIMVGHGLEDEDKEDE